MKFIIVRPNQMDIPCDEHPLKLATVADRNLTTFLCEECLRENLAEIGVFIETGRK